MKKAFGTIALFLLLTLCLTPPSSCRGETAERLRRPEDVDLSNVTEKDGRLTGEILLYSENGDAPLSLQVDCPVPEPFPADRQLRLTVRYEGEDKERMVSLLNELGQDVSVKQTRAWNLGWANHGLFFSRSGAEQNGDAYHHYSVGMLQQSRSSSGREREMETAKQFARDVLTALGAEASETFLQALRNTPQDALACYGPSDSSSWYPELLQLTEERLAGQDRVTLVHADYQLFGLPVMPQFSYREGEELFGDSSYLELVVNDDGQCEQLTLYNLPVVEKTEAYPLAERGWEELLRLWATDVWVPSAKDEPVLSDGRYGDYTRYGSRKVLTAFLPCWVGREKGLLEPGWFAETREYLVKDGTLCGIRDTYMDATEMARIN